MGRTEREELEKFKRFTVIGGGVSGTGLALLANGLGVEVFVSEERSELPAEGAERLKEAGIEWEMGGHSSRAFDTDALLLSSGIPPDARCVREAEKLGIPVVGELDFVVPHLRGRLVGVTGSNGKSTLTALIGHLLKKSGLKVAVGGNIGEAASSFAGESFDHIVLELSSFQLHRAHDLKCAVAVATNRAPDHIDWHGSREAYFAAKTRLFSLQDSRGWAVAQDRDAEVLGLKGPKLERTVVLSWTERPESAAAGHILMGEDAAVLRTRLKEGEEEERLLFRYADTSLLGRHNLENVAMAFTAARLAGADVPAERAREFLGDFSPLPHRCELVGTLGGVTYVDDSKGTNVAASATALSSIDGRKVVILGGKGKGEDYAPLAEAVAREADAAVLMGAEKDRIASALRERGFSAVSVAGDMEEAVCTARRLARPGMVILLSPACTSWDMYESYKKRGEHFRAVFQSLGV
jgi:UDP-N-acetylmuramoylalanine--D-glutamate ligase